MQDIIRQLEKKRAGARMGGGQHRIDAQHGKGKPTAQRYWPTREIWHCTCKLSDRRKLRLIGIWP